MATTLYGIKNCELFLVEKPRLGVIHIQDLKKTLHLKFLLRSCSVSIFAAWFDGHFSPSKRQPIPD
ncbi:hypothetical protein, partial [Aeromonas sp. QDB50]|uniref:hypothetical protein n=1 Tax=Aeromonas sp. QDB50 TaxID=2990493 RepID=UPI0022DE9EF9